MKNYLLIITSFLFILGATACGGSSNQSGPLSTLQHDEKAQAIEAFTLLFNMMDIDGNGLVSKEEFMSAKISRFHELDSDGNKVLEQSDMGGSSNVVYFIPYDSDGDGVATKDEYRQYYADIFNQYLDATGTREISLDDMLAAFGLRE